MKRIFSHTWKVLTQKERKHFSLLICGDIFTSIIDILFLVLLLWIVQFYIQPGKDSPSFLPLWLADKNSVLLIAIFLFLFAVKNITAFFIARAHYQFNNSVAIRITYNNLYNYQRATFEEFINVDSSVLLRKINLQPFEFCQHILAGIQQIITQFSLILIAVIAILLFNAKLFILLLCLLLPPVVIIFYVIRKRLNKIKTDLRNSNERSYQHLLDALKGYAESNIYDRHEFFMNRYMSDRKKFGKSLFESISIQNMPSRIIEVFAVLGLFILIAVAKWTRNTDNTYFVTIGAFMAAAYKIIPGIVKIINLGGQIKAYDFSTNDLAGSIKEDDDKKESINIQSFQLKNISFQYNGQPVLNNFSLAIDKGDFIGITGKSGIGKTTLFNILSGFLSQAKGEIIINGIPVPHGEIKNYWPGISYVRQQSFFIHDTLLKNITLEEKGYNKQLLQCALNATGLKELIDNSPEGLDKMITENGKNISGGQQQRIALARALYKNADLVLLDEPFNELDERSVNCILKYFNGLAAKGKMIVLITHDNKSLAYCNKIISLHEQ